MKLYTNSYGPGPRRIFIYLGLKGLTEVEVVPVVPYVETRTPEFLKKNPAGKIPLLETERGEYVFESQCILQYLEERFPEPAMMRTEESALRRLDVQSGMVNEFFFYLYISSLHTSPYVSKGLVQAYDADIVASPLWRARLDQIEQLMAGADFLVDDAPSIPDVMLYSMLEYIRYRFGTVIPPHLKALHRWYDRFEALPGVDPIALPDNYFDESIPRLGRRY